MVVGCGSDYFVSEKGVSTWNISGELAANTSLSF